MGGGYKDRTDSEFLERLACLLDRLYERVQYILIYLLIYLPSIHPSIDCFFFWF